MPVKTLQLPCRKIRRTQRPCYYQDGDATPASWQTSRMGRAAAILPHMRLQHLTGKGKKDSPDELWRSNISDRQLNV